MTLKASVMPRCWPLALSHEGQGEKTGVSAVVSRVKRDFACTLTGALPPVLVVLRGQSRLGLEGRARTLSGPSPDLSRAHTVDDHSSAW